jgi:hypothetical protein
LQYFQLLFQSRWRVGRNQVWPAPPSQSIVSLCFSTAGTNDVLSVSLASQCVGGKNATILSAPAVHPRLVFFPSGWNGNRYAVSFHQPRCLLVALHRIQLAIFIQLIFHLHIGIGPSGRTSLRNQISYQSAIGERVSGRCLIHFGRILSAVRIVRILQPVKTQSALSDVSGWQKMTHMAIWPSVT